MHRPRILIADQDPEIRALLASIIQNEGFSPVVVDNGREAFRRLQNDAQFTAGIFDFTLPQLEGLDLIRYMKTEKRLMRIPVMMTSSHPDVKQMSDSFGAGAVMFLAKPFSPDKLQATLRILLNSGQASVGSRGN